MTLGLARRSDSRRRAALSCIVTVVVSSPLLLSACATIGHEFPASRVSEIRMGETSEADVLAMFGTPWRVGIEDGQRTWTYGRYRYRLFGQARSEDLVLRFNSQGVVVSYTFSTTEHDQ
jgi:hypothetical protein